MPDSVMRLVVGDAGAIRDQGTILPERAAEIREPKSETRQLLDELLEEAGLDSASVRRRTFELIPGGRS